MTGRVERAVGVVIQDGRVLTMRRHKEGRDYCVLPGGGIEAGESPSIAVVREVAEETGLAATVKRCLWTIEHPDRVAHYFLLGVGAGPMRVGGPEAASQAENNRYTPEWVALQDLDTANLQPESLRDRLRQLGGARSTASPVESVDSD